MREYRRCRNLVLLHLACTSLVDSQSRRLHASIDEAGLASDTIAVVWGDSGWHSGETGITGR